MSNLHPYETLFKDLKKGKHTVTIKATVITVVCSLLFVSYVETNTFLNISQKAIIVKCNKTIF